MKIEAPQENKIVVELTQEDMSELDITYEEMDYSNIETRRVIWTILDRARRTLRRDIDPSEKMLIETVPTPQGGCVLYFTVFAQPYRPAGVRQVLRLSKEAAALVYRFDNLTALTDCAVKLREALPELPRSSLYELQGDYVLCVQSEQPLRRCRMLLAEYGERSEEGELTAAYLCEHGKLLSRDDALERLTIGL